jgi:SPP1 family predicted phage head-tail adaptor
MVDRIADINLISRTYASSDTIGQQVATETIKTVVAELKSINRSEWVAAHQVGYNPVVTAIVSAFDYNNEEIVEIDSERYVVYRTYSRKDDYIELMLRKKVGEADE